MYFYAEAGKVTVGLASHQPYVTDSTSTYRLNDLRKGEEPPADTPSKEYSPLYLFYLA